MFKVTFLVTRKESYLDRYDLDDLLDAMSWQLIHGRELLDFASDDEAKVTYAFDPFIAEWDLVLKIEKSLLTVQVSAI